MRKKLYRYIIRKLFKVHFMVERAMYSQWFGDPICSEPLATKDHYLKLAKLAREQSYVEVELYEHQCGSFIDSEWLDDLALHTQVIIKSSPICYAHGRVLYSALSRYLEDNPSRLGIRTNNRS